MSRKNDHPENVLGDLLYKKTGERVVAVHPLKGGFNSLIYKVLTALDSEYVAKKYLIHNGDTRDRFSTEFLGISFLWDNGIRAVPEPICSDEKHQIGLYRFIKGNKLKPGEISQSDICLASEFLGALHALSHVKGADKQPIASEACFSIKTHIDCIENRVKRLKDLPVRNRVFKNLRTYIQNEFLPFFAEIKQFVKRETTQRKIDINRELQTSEKTLSPSDFGFHNAIKCDDGSLVFIDFEYYGWDDPAKMIADFYLQPAVPVPSVYKKTFFETLHQYFDKDVALVRRLPFVYILLAMKWPLIMLNVFLPKVPNTGFNEETYIKQLEKARNKLKKTMSEFEQRVFPLILL